MRDPIQDPPKEGEPHYEEFDAVRRCLMTEIDMIAWKAVTVAYGKAAFFWKKEYEIAQYCAEHGILSLKFLLCVANKEDVNKFADGLFP